MLPALSDALGGPGSQTRTSSYFLYKKMLSASRCLQPTLMASWAGLFSISTCVWFVQINVHREVDDVVLGLHTSLSNLFVKEFKFKASLMHQILFLQVVCNTIQPNNTIQPTCKYNPAKTFSMHYIFTKASSQ